MKTLQESIICFDCDRLIHKGTLEKEVHECEKCHELLCDSCANYCPGCVHYYCLVHFDFNKGCCVDCADINE